MNENPYYKPNEATAVIYGLIRQQEYKEAIKILEFELQSTTSSPSLPSSVSTSSRACLSLLAYCHYHDQQFAQAADYYDALIKLLPDNMDYQFYRAQSLYSAGLYVEALRACSRIDFRTNPTSSSASSSYHPHQDEDDVLKIKVRLLQAHIFYAQEDFHNSKAIIEKLMIDFPNELEIHLLDAAITFREGDFKKAKTLYQNIISTFYPGHEDYHNMALNSIKNNKNNNYNMNTNLNNINYQLDLAYNIALCEFNDKNYASSMQIVHEIIDTNLRLHPELGIGTATELLQQQILTNSMSNNPNESTSILSNLNNLELRSVGNSSSLKESCLIEAHNLKAAIEYELYVHEPAKVLHQYQHNLQLQQANELNNQHDHLQAAMDALTDMPYRTESELDVITLHNQALIFIHQDPASSFKKLSFLLANPPYPNSTFLNLLHLYCHYKHYDLVAELLAANSNLVLKYLTQEEFDYFEACVLLTTSVDEAYLKFDILSNKYIERLRNLTKQIQDVRLNRDGRSGSNEETNHNLLKSLLLKYDEEINAFIPILMKQISIYWNLNNYVMVEKILLSCNEFLHDNEIWKLNYAHVLYVQENKYNEAIKYYEPIITRLTSSPSNNMNSNYLMNGSSSSSSLLDIQAIILANLCVSYIMTSQNEIAEDLMRRIEKEEERLSYNFNNNSLSNSSPSSNYYHLCIVNLVIGTLYCAKGNFEFGISRIIKSLEPYEKKLHYDTWYYAKRCFMALLDLLAKNLLVLKDSSFVEIFDFLNQIEKVGKNFSAEMNEEIVLDIDMNTEKKHKNTIGYEARQLKNLFLKFYYH